MAAKWMRYLEVASFAVTICGVALGTTIAWKPAFVRLRAASPRQIEQNTQPSFVKSFFADGQGWAVTVNNDLFMTTDEGSTWTESVIPAQGKLDLSGVYFDDHQGGWVVGALDGTAVILRTRDNGASWIEALHLPRRPSWSGLADVWFANDRLGWAVGTIRDDGVQGLVLRTEDGGAKWESQNIDGDLTGTLRRVRFSDANRGWAVGDWVILRTVDAGKSWYPQFTDFGVYMDGLAVVSGAEAWATGAFGLVLHTVDGGDHWNKIVIPGQVRDRWLGGVAFKDKNRGWIAGQNGLILSTEDGGAVWRIEETHSEAYLHDIAVTSNRVIALGKQGTVLFRDLGGTAH